MFRDTSGVATYKHAETQARTRDFDNNKKVQELNPYLEESSNWILSFCFFFCDFMFKIFLPMTH